VAGSALAFGGYYRLVERVGAARAGYVGVMVPVVALVVSTVLEGFTWTLVSAIGVAVAVIGNVLTLATTPSRAAAADAAAGSSTDGTAAPPPAAAPVSPARAAGR
jgi:drug/metabolite transporter (DMT)-like permease